MKLLAIRLTRRIAAALFLSTTLSTVAFASSMQANDLVKAEAFNTSEFSVSMNLAVTQSVKLISINENFAKNTADEILVNQVNQLDKINTKTTEQASIIAE
jgi:hypothetical protein